jgi:hypothetical protein
LVAFILLGDAGQALIERAQQQALRDNPAIADESLAAADAISDAALKVVDHPLFADTRAELKTTREKYVASQEQYLAARDQTVKVKEDALREVLALNQKLVIAQAHAIVHTQEMKAVQARALAPRREDTNARAMEAVLSRFQEPPMPAITQPTPTPQGRRVKIPLL